MKRFAVIGAGSFGYHVAKDLYANKNEVIAIDRAKEKVQAIEPHCTSAIVADVTDFEALKGLGLEEMDAVIVSTGADIKPSILICFHLSRLGIKRIIAKAEDDDHGEILKQLGAADIIRPGMDMAHRLALRIASTGGQRTIFVAFRIVAVQEAPAINLNPQRLDMGGLAPGTAVSRRIEMTNSGKEMLTWSIVKPKTGKSASSAAFKKERYISFYGNVDKLKGSYTLPEHLKNKMELLGKWTAPDGYPQTRGAVGTLKYAFYGTGIKLYLKTHSEEGNLLFYINDQLLNLHDWLAHDQGVHELVLAEHLPLGQHVLTVVCRDGRVELEGAKTLGMDVMRGPAGWMTVFPISGTTTSETAYINVRINTDGMAPGYYADEINFRDIQ